MKEFTTGYIYLVYTRQRILLTRDLIGFTICLN